MRKRNNNLIQSCFFYKRLELAGRLQANDTITRSWCVHYEFNLSENAEHVLKLSLNEWKASATLGFQHLFRVNGRILHAVLYDWYISQNHDT